MESAIKNLTSEVERLQKLYDWQVAENERLRNELRATNKTFFMFREALKPFAEKYLWPDDSGIADELRSDEDWDEERNQEEIDDVWIKRAWIRQARAALKETE